MMARNVRVLNLSRTTVRIGAKNVPPAVSNPEPTVIDMADGASRRDLKRFASNLVVLGTEQGLRTVVVPLAAVATAGGALGWQNTTGKRIHVVRVDLDVTTASSGACTLDVGATPTSATTSVDNLLDGISVASTGIKSSTDATDKGTNGQSKGVMVAAGGFVTGSQASGAVAGLAGNAIISYTVAV